MIDSLAKDIIPVLIDKYKHNKYIVAILEARQKLSRSSIKKFTSMVECACSDNRVRGTFQFYGGAGRTGRWAGRLSTSYKTLSKKNHLENIDISRDLVRNTCDGDGVELLYDDVSDILSQLVRTAFIAKPGCTFYVADFSAIEARVVSWLANEQWRIDVFKSHGKIYEAAAARMFNVPIEHVTKGSDLRAKAKNAELALGYQGSLGAMKRMGGEKMGMSDAEMMSIVHKWRKANTKIVELWADMEECAHKAAMYLDNEVISENRGIKFLCDGESLMITLPSSHVLHYRNPHFKINKFGTRCLCYDGIIQETKTWGDIDTYGGKLTENIVQAISRDILGYSMLRLEEEGFNTVMHVHDEAINEDTNENAEANMKNYV